MKNGMKKTMKHPVTVIKRSCITGNPVWLYQGPSESAARRAYSRACNFEIDRVKNWAATVARRTANIVGFLNECLEKLPKDAELTPVQAAAVRKLQAIARKAPACHLEFYEHIMASRRKIKHNRDYDKQDQ